MTYVIDTKTDAPVVTLAEMKVWLKIPVSITAEDALITSLIAAAVTRAEKFMNRDILTTTWFNYRDSFLTDLTLRRGGFQELTTIEYLLDGSFVTLSTDDYVVTIGGSFGIVCEIDRPTVDDQCNSVKITFKTGFGDASSAVPEDIKTAIKFDVSNMYANRGDCKDADNAIPKVAFGTYRNYKIIDISQDEFVNNNRILVGG